MPTYEYRCRDCARDFEVFQRMSDRPGAPCPDCGRDAERLISGGAGLLFKGDGFYITDYRSDDYRKKASAEAGDAGGDPAKGDSAREKSKQKSSGGAKAGSSTGDSAASSARGARDA